MTFCLDFVQEFGLWLLFRAKHINRGSSLILEEFLNFLYFTRPLFVLCTMYSHSSKVGGGGGGVGIAIVRGREKM
jgi:hypothetical protein